MTVTSVDVVAASIFTRLPKVEDVKLAGVKTRAV